MQNLLDLRVKELEEKQIEFGKLQFVMKKLQNELADFQAELVVSKQNLEKLLSQGKDISINLIQANNRHILQKESDIMAQNKKIEEHDIQLKAKQQEMFEALKAKTMLEKLKEKQYKSFLKAVDMAERKELDEIGLMRYAR